MNHHQFTFSIRNVETAEAHGKQDILGVCQSVRSWVLQKTQVQDMQVRSSEILGVMALGLKAV